MKYQIAFVFSLTTVFGQEITSYTYDVNGRPVPGATRSIDASPAETKRAETVRNLNGRDVPIQTVDQKVISDNGTVRVTERIVRRYDANGRPGPAEKTLIEERKNPDGSLNTSTTTMREDINGQMSVAERSITEARKSGDTTTTNTVVERPTLSGGLEVVEKREGS
ncbi:MAG TPA: hypothetical protein VE621_06215, partial [Bryobacteraceae bacterium]|nr:hypothetical protein [Bryobacteraceae bacterium]